jgi:hypothetical protein
MSNKSSPVIKPLKLELSGDGRFNLKNVLEMTINLMEIAENFQEVEGSERKDYVIHKMKTKLGMLYPSYEHEIDTIIESVIFMTKLGRVIMLNHQNIRKSCSGCLKF